MLFHGIPPAFIFDSAGPGEWIVLFVVVLIVVGPKRLPEVARKLGRMMEMFRRAADEFKSQIMTMDQPEPKPYTPPPSETDLSSDGTTDPYAGGEDGSSASYAESSAADADGVPSASADGSFPSGDGMSPENGATDTEEHTASSSETNTQEEGGRE